LRNIFKELQQEGLAPRTQSGSLTGWAQQGVLLLNTCLTVERGLPASHAKRGWEYLTDAVIAHIARTAPVCVYMLWGAHAQTKAPAVREIAEKHGQQVLLLQANHPSPLSALRLPTPFIGCGHFQQANQFLIQTNSSPIDWQHTG
jgi:uracil-DNA glycosylase